MSDKKTFVLRLQPKMYEAIEKWAADEFRSVNGQIEFILQKAIIDAKRVNVKNSKSIDSEGIE